MMVQTTVAGTGSKAFGARPKSLRGMEIGGKTGSLSAPEGELFRHVSWFIGFAPAENPKVAVAALAINGWKWKVKAPALARDAMGLYFDQAGKQTAGAAPSPVEMRAPALAIGTAAAARGAELSLLPLDGGPGSL
jgi:cell division protein FtsI/penicillin-binding protein 2